ncbi:MAG: glycosyltransferase family 2 protein [Firmicutes bacterium]|nr:glycosyltransferase family 2 protein [Bacillota bacterium]
MDKLSIVVPCFNEEESISYFYDAIKEQEKKMKGVTFELIFVNDGSKDGTLKKMKELHKKDKSVKYLSFSRNFGKEAGIYAGLEHATGNYVTLMDVDLQDPPELLTEMYDILKNEDYDVVATRSISRNGYSFIRKTFTRWFYKIINKISKVEMIDGARDFRLMKRKVVNEILNMKEYNRYSKGLFSFIGFETKWITYENPERSAGTTKFNFWKLFAYAVEGIIGFSTVPLAIAALVGVIFCIISFLMIAVIIIRTLIWSDPTSGWPSMVCIMFFLSGIQLFCTGIIGEYLAKTYLETKHRPLYIIRESSEEEE